MRREAWGVRREAWGVRREASAAHLVRSFKEKVIEISSKKIFYMSMVSIAWLLLIFSNFWKTRWPPQPFFCWLRILTTSDQLKEKLWIYLHQTFHMDIRWHKLGWYWFSAIFEKQDGRHNHFLLTQNIDDVRSIKGKVMNISSPNVSYGYKVA